MLHNLRFALRQIARAPGFAALACITLAVGIGISAAMFAVLQSTLLLPLPYAHPDRLVVLDAKDINYPQLLRWRQRDRDLEFGYYFAFPTSLDEKSSSEFVIRVATGANLFKLLGVKPMLGRGLTEAEQQPGHNLEAVIPERLWRDKFRSNPSILGSTIRIGREPYTVVGVMPQHFTFPMNSGNAYKIWVPYELTEKFVSGHANLANFIARLRPGIGAAAAARNLTAIQTTLHKQNPKKYAAQQVRLQSYSDSVKSGSANALLALAAAVGLVWLIASTNVAALMLTRVHGRRRELAIRSALGAGTFRILIQLLTESLLLCVISCILGVALCAAALKLLGHTLLDYATAFHFSPEMLLVLIGATVLSTLLVGVLPVFHIAASPIQQGLHESSSRCGMSRRQNRARDLFVVVQVALSVLLLVSAGMMLRTLYALHHVQLAFRTSHVLTTALMIPQGEYAKRDIVTTLYEPLLNRIQAIPGVSDAAISSILPVNPHFFMSGGFEFPEHPNPDPAHQPSAAFRLVSPNLDSLLGIRIVRGRELTSRDTVGTEPVAVVNQAFVRRYFPRQNPLGHRIKVGDQGPHMFYTIVGVARDVHQTALNRPVKPEVDVSYLQVSPKDLLATPLRMFMSLALRTHQDPKAAGPEIRSILHDINPDLILNPFQTMRESVDASFGDQTLAAHLLALFAAIALLIAGAGLYTLLAYSVGQRRREIGIRIALGAQRGQVLRMIFSHAVAVTGIGIAIGLAASWFAARTLESFLYGVPPHDWPTMLAVAAVLLAISMLAAYLPARAAASVDPMIALRAE